MTSFQLSYFDASYDVSFRAPFFELIRSAPDVFETFFRELYEVWELGSQDLRIVQSPVVGDNYVQVSLFRGNGEARVTTSGCHILFRNAVEKDVGLVLRASEACLRAVNSHVPTTLWASESIRGHLTLTLDSEDERARFLKRIGSPLAQTSNAPNSIVFPAFKVEHRSAASPADWNASVEITQRWSAPDSLYVVVSGSFHSEAAKDSPDERLKSRVAKVADVSSEVLRALGLEQKRT